MLLAPHADIQNEASAEHAESLSYMRDNELMTVKDLSRYLRLHPSTIYRLLKEEKLPGFKVGDSWRFSPDDIILWRDAQTRIHTRK